MPSVRTLLVVGVVAAFAAIAPAQTPPTPASPTTPAVTADEPTPEVVPVTVFKPADPWIMRVPVVYWAGLLAVVVIALFVVRWQKTGELPTDSPPKP